VNTIDVFDPSEIRKIIESFLNRVKFEGKIVYGTGFEYLLISEGLL